MLPDLRALQEFPARAAARLREAARSAAFLVAAAILIVVASGFGLAALYLWLSAQMANYHAALLTAAAPLSVGAILVVIALTPRRRTAVGAPAQPQEPPIPVTAEQAGAAAARAALSELQSNPAGALAAALAVGIMAGMLSSPRK